MARNALLGSALCRPGTSLSWIIAPNALAVYYTSEQDSCAVEDRVVHFLDQCLQVWSWNIPHLLDIEALSHLIKQSVESFSKLSPRKLSGSFTLMDFL